MEIKSVRVGNLVDLYGTIATIQVEDFGGKGVAISAGKPIPLTEKWLDNFGFEKYDNPNGSDSYIFRKGKIKLIRSKYSKQPYRLRDWYETNVEIIHVHQLQNIHYLLTQSELKRERYATA